MQDFKPLPWSAPPVMPLRIADTMLEMGININALSLRWGLFGAEPWSVGNAHGDQYKLNITATDNYGLSEVMGPV